jgi:CheY-like chemotaxis protein
MPSTVALRGLPVLIVDRNPVSGRVLDELTRFWDMQPTVVDGCEAALSALRSAEAGCAPFRFVLWDSHVSEMDDLQFAGRIAKDRLSGGAHLVLLSSTGYRPGFETCRESGVAAIVTKPAYRTELLTTLLRLLTGTESTEGASTPSPREPERRGRELSILLAEDNFTNQRLVARLLEKMGHSVTLAGNGREAVAISAEKEFDAILMDVQMPEMDGYQATAAIRRRESDCGSARTPIIALTAHAMTGDRDLCLAAGMDCYLTKPIEPHDLRATLESVTQGSPVPAYFHRG